MSTAAKTENGVKEPVEVQVATSKPVGISGNQEEGGLSDEEGLDQEGSRYCFRRELK